MPHESTLRAGGNDYKAYNSPLEGTRGNVATLIYWDTGTGWAEARQIKVQNVYAETAELAGMELLKWAVENLDPEATYLP